MTGNVAFMFVCTIMVFFMTPGLAFFYGGMVRRKNALNTMMFCMAMLGIGIFLWILVGYSLSFGTDHAGIIGDLDNILLRHVSWEVTGGEGEAPEMISVLFNMMFAVISPAIILGHNIPLFLLGASMLWMGWFCFNCGCAGGANSIAVLAFANTALSSAASMIVWMIIEAVVQKKCTIMGAMTGGIVGLVGITPGAGFVPLWTSILIGATTAPICYLAISKLKNKLGYDDALDSFGCHGVGGIWGGIVTGIFATKQVNAAVPHEGLLYEDYRLFLSQLGAIGISIAVAVVMTTLIMLVLKKCGGVRVPDLEEAQGLDLIEHGERAYPAFNGLD